MADSEARAHRLILFAVVALLGGTALAWSLFIVRDALQLLYLSVILALGFSPTVRWIEQRPLLGRKRKVPRTLAVLIGYAGLLALVAGILEIILPAIVSQARDLGTHLPDYLAHAQGWLVSHHLLLRSFSLAELLQHGPSPNDTMSSVFGVVNRALAFVITAFTVLVLSFYLLIEGEPLFLDFVRWLPRDQREAWRNIALDVGLKVGAWMNGQFLLCVMIGTSAGIGFWLIGMPYFYVLALVCGLGELIPMLGPLFSAVPALLLAATISGNTVVVVALFLFVLQQLESNVIVPRLMQKQTGMSALIVIVAIIIGGSLLGVLGALLAVPTAAVIQILVREYLTHRDGQ